jgi:anti-anti-sigma regulatory factor
MTNQPTDVIVMTVPEEADAKQQQSFLGELADRMSEYRPYIVLDCSRLTVMDGPRIYFLLCCLEEALKRNGDARLAGMPAPAKKMLQAAGADKIFQMFASSGDAIGSFFPHNARLERPAEAQGGEDRISQNAA